MKELERWPILGHRIDVNDSDPSRARKIVLIIEDDDAVARTLVRILGTLCDVKRGRSLAEGLQLIEELDYAALICDWDLGDGTGAVALIRSAERHPEARRVLYTGRARDEVSASLPPGVAHAILHKPSAPGAIIAALDLT